MDPIPATTSTTTTAAATAASTVQHVNKKSSDELLRKFADSGDEAEGPTKKQLVRVLKRRKLRSRKNGEGDQCESLTNGKSSLVERRSLLPAGTNKNKAFLRQIATHGRAAHLRAREIRNKSLFGTIHKTWRRTIEGASKVFMEKHYNRHKRLISDIA